MPNIVMAVLESTTYRGHYKTYILLQNLIATKKHVRPLITTLTKKDIKAMTLNQHEVVLFMCYDVSVNGVDSKVFLLDDLVQNPKYLNLVRV